MKLYITIGDEIATNEATILHIEGYHNDGQCAVVTECELDEDGNELPGETELLTPPDILRRVDGYTQVVFR